VTTAPATRHVDIELSLLRVVVGYRVFAAVWLTVLALITLAGGRSRADWPWVVVATVVATTLWTALTAYLSFRSTRVLRSWGFLLADAVIAVLALLSADLAGSEAFSGGYPLTAVFHSIYARGTWAGMTAAAALTVAAVYRVIQTEGADLTAATGSMIVFLFAGAAAAWGVRVIRSNDRRTRQMEAALAAEHTERARAEERAEMAAHLHDSVLQTLALIQRRSGEPAEVTTLARSQERELRQWLYESGDSTGQAGFRETIEEVAAEVEALAGVPVDVVVVGTTRCDDEVAALMRAVREAALNAAKHSGADRVAVYGEVEGDRISVFVRDRGCGFDPEAVPADRKGIRESILARVARHGGTATIVSSPGSGTEVRLEMTKGPRGE